MLEDKALILRGKALQYRDNEDRQLAVVAQEMMAIQAIGKLHQTAFDAGSELILASAQQAIEALDHLAQLEETYSRNSKSADIIDTARQQVKAARRHAVLSYWDALNRQHKDK